MKILLDKIIVLIFISSYSFGSALVELNYILFSDNNSIESTTSASSSKSMYNICLAFSVGNKKSLYFGWGLYNVLTKDEVNNQQSNYSTQDMGPYLRYEFGRSKTFYAGFIYGIQTQTYYDSGSTAEEWLGTNYLIQLGVNPEVSESLFVNFSFNYFNGAASKKVVSSTQSDVAYSKAFMSPSVGISYKW